LASPRSAVATARVPLPSRKVRTILRLEARARRLLARYERALAAAARAKGEAHVLFDQADGLERALGAGQLRGNSIIAREPAGPVLSLVHGQTYVRLALSEHSLRALGLAIIASIGSEG
jgi:hypothetical protein